MGGAIPADGRPVKDTIGRYPEWSLADARNEAASRLKQAHRGIDPRDRRKAERRAEGERKAPPFVPLATNSSRSIASGATATGKGPKAF